MRVIAIALSLPLFAVSVSEVPCRTNCASRTNCDTCTGNKEGFCLKSRSNCLECSGVWCPVPTPPPAPTPPPTPTPSPAPTPPAPTPTPSPAPTPPPAPFVMDVPCRFSCGSPASCNTCTGAKEGFCLESPANCAKCVGTWCPVAPSPPAPTIPNLKGVNQACADFGQSLPGRIDQDYTFPLEASIDHFASLGFGAVRIPFLWERLQPNLRAGFTGNYFSLLNKTVNQVTHRGMHAIIDPHNYARYSKSGSVSGGKIIGAPGSGVSVADFADFWTRLANAFKGNPNVIFAIMNEPNTMSTRLWAETAQAATDAIRETGASQLVLVPGNGWTGAHSWLESWYDTAAEGLSNAQAFENFTDSGNNFAFEMHQYLDADAGGRTNLCNSSSVGVDGLAGATQWLEEHNFRGFLGEFAGGRSAVCEQAIDAMLAHMDSHPVWLGWTWWAAGPWWGTSTSEFPIEPASDGTDQPQVAWLLKHVASSTIV